MFLSLFLHVVWTVWCIVMQQSLERQPATLISDFLFGFYFFLYHLL